MVPKIYGLSRDWTLELDTKSRSLWPVWRVRSYYGIYPHSFF